MNIYVDESGTFTTATRRDSWCVVVAYASPERDAVTLDRLVWNLRVECGGGAEVKLSGISEVRYARFLKDLAKLNGLLFAVAVDVSLHPTSAVIAHRDSQAAKVIEHREKMLFESGKQSLTSLSDAVAALPAQLYTQMICQVELFHRVLKFAPLYYSQRIPETLGSLRWRLDRKADELTRYEATFETIVAPLLQTRSFRDPMPMLEGADYTHFARFDFPPEEQPEYLKEAYGLEQGPGANLGKMLREDFSLVDSRKEPGVQVADLLASGLRRVLRGNFDRPDILAYLLGSNMVQDQRGKPVVKLISLGEGALVPDRSAHLLRTMAAAAKPMLAR